jgi:uridine kinase
MQIKVNKGESYEFIYKKYFSHLKYVTCVLVEGVVKQLDQAVDLDRNAEFLCANKSEQASRVYFSGVSFLAFRAIRKLYGKSVNFRVEHALSSGIYCSIDGIKALSPMDVVNVERVMYEITDEDSSFVYHKVPKDVAVGMFEQDGQHDKVKLLKYRPLNYVRYYENGDEVDYFYGEMVPSTGYIKDFKLFYYSSGFVIKCPTPFMRKTSYFEEEPKLFDVFKKSDDWARVLKVSNVSDINKLSDLRRLSEFININEALHESSISDIAKLIIVHKEARIVLIAGPSSSGKTTFAGRLKTHLKVLKRSAFSISLDDYYIDRSDLPIGENGKKDFETIDALDTHLFNENMISLLEGKETMLPVFNFKTGSREEKYKGLQIQGDEILIVEGIHGLNDELTRLVPKQYKFKIFISPLTTLNLDSHNIVYPEDLRLLRRIVRDKRTRGFSVETTLNMWHDVRHGEYKYILPYKENADVMFNSTLIYEPMILKKYAMEELQKINRNTTEYRFAARLLKFLNYFSSSDLDDEIAKNSLLREFIGDQVHE